MVAAVPLAPLAQAAAQTVVPLPPARPVAMPRGAAATPAGQSAADDTPGTAAGIPLPPPRPPEPQPSPRPPIAGPAPALPPVPAQASTPAPAPGPSPWTAPGSTIHEGPTPLVPGAFPVDQMDAACTRILASGKVVGRRVPAIQGPDGCGIAYPIALQAVVLGDGQHVAMDPAPILRCDLADRLADWLRDDLAQLGAERGRLIAVTNATAYMCRGRNNVAGAPMSEHGHGDAIDILALRFARQEVRLRQEDAHALWTQVKASACTRFMTVLARAPTVTMKTICISISKAAEMGHIIAIGMIPEPSVV